MHWLLPFLLLTCPLWAAPRVGPLDGAQGPSLPAVSMPMLAQEEELPNTALPMALEDKGLYEAALLEWARIEQDARGPERTQALSRLMILSELTGQPIAAQAYEQQWRALNPTAPTPPELAYVRYLMGQPDAEVEASLNTLATTAPNDYYSVLMRWEALWHEAANTGRILKTYNLPAGVQLQERLKFLRTKDLANFMLVVGLAVIPGAGHLFLQQWAMASVLLLGWAVFGLAFLSACRHRHYAYAFVWAFPFMALWLNSPLAAAQAAEAAAHTARVQALKDWQDLRPTYIPAT
jgi:hypothetical protein